MSGDARLQAVPPPFGGSASVRRWTLRALLALVLLVLAAVSAGALYQSFATARDRGRFPAPGRLVDVGGRRLHLWVQGSGTPAVVMDGPVGSGCLGWSLVQPEVAKSTTAVSADRAGYGWSDPAAGPHTCGRAVEDLRTGLRAAGVPPPYVLVGASLGGCDARLFAFRYPGEVAGLVLVDPADEEMFGAMPPSVRAETENTTPLRLFQAASRLGLLRLLDMPVDIAGMKVLTGEAQARAAAVGLRSSAVDAIVAETAALETSFAQVRAARERAGSPPLGDLPLVVLTHQEDPPPQAAAAEAYAAWVKLHAALARESTRGRQVVVARSGHFIAVDQPKAVVEAIATVLDGVRDGASRGFVPTGG